MQQTRPWRAARFLATAAALSLVFSAGKLQADSAPHPQDLDGTHSVSGKAAKSVESAIVKGTNRERRKKGRSALRNNAAMAAVARDYSRLMAEKNFFSHVDPNGKTVIDRFNKAGIAWSWIGENLARMPDDGNLAATTVAAWMKSPTHRKNILRRQFSEIGIGIWKQGDTYYVTQVFRNP